jgi:hypothetical protein
LQPITFGLVVSTVLLMASLFCMSLLLVTFLSGFDRGRRSGATAAHAATAAAVARVTATFQTADLERNLGEAEALVSVLLPFGEWAARREGSVLFLQGQPLASSAANPEPTLQATVETSSTSGTTGGTRTSRSGTVGSKISSLSGDSRISAEIGNLYEVVQLAVSLICLLH